jgi:cell division septum initiation protein DivIVA
MTNNQQTNWLSLDKLPLFTDMVAGMLQDTEKMIPLFRQAKEKPWVLDDATVVRSIRLYTERLAILSDYEEQIARWRNDTLPAWQKQAIDKLAHQTAQTKKEVTQLLAIANEIKQNTIDQILARDDVELAFDVLSGKLKLPKG